MEKRNIIKPVLLMKADSTAATDPKPALPIKLFLPANKNIINITKMPNVISKIKPNQIYHQRKSMQTAYKDLFAALWHLPDKEVQQRVLDAINGKMKTFSTVATQTDLDMVKETTTTIRTTDLSNLSNLTQAETNTKKLLNKKPKRKRRVLMPQVSKVSHTALAFRNQHLPNIIKKRKTEIFKPNNNDKDAATNENVQPNKRTRLDSFSYLLSTDCSALDFDLLNEFIFEKNNQKGVLLKEMIKEFLIAPIRMDNGLLPIHETIIDNHSIRLKRHIYIWQEIKKVDLNELLTNEEEDCLQLAIANNCFPPIINLLLLKGLNANSLDSHNNTVVHLAILHNIEIASMEYLLKYIELKQLLLLNDDGYTPLHLAVRHERYLLAECLLNTLDKNSLGKIYYERSINYNTLDSDSETEKKEFLKYYENVCLKMNAENDAKYCIKNCDLKNELLIACDMCAGNTALYFAMENKLESMIYFLLAHLSDPRIQNFSGQDAKSFYNEFGRSLGLNLEIDYTMDKVIKLLQIIV